MSAQTERILRTPARTARWMMVALAAAIAVGTAIVLPRVLSGSPHVRATDDGRSTVTTPRDYGNQVVTGTGPGLVQVAEQSRAARLVTGTGPGLVQLAEQSRLAVMYHASQVAGTGLEPTHESTHRPSSSRRRRRFLNQRPPLSISISERTLCYL